MMYGDSQIMLQGLMPQIGRTAGNIIQFDYKQITPQAKLDYLKELYIKLDILNTFYNSTEAQYAFPDSSFEYDLYQALAMTNKEELGEGGDLVAHMLSGSNMKSHLRNAIRETEDYTDETKLEDVYESDLDWRFENLTEIMMQVAMELPRVKRVLAMEYKLDPPETLVA